VGKTPKVSEMPTTLLTIRDLRRRWKPHKERLGSHPTAIRFHRACSWLDRAEKLEAADHDLVLINQWIALNSLYGQWDARTNEPQPDRERWRGFVSRLLKLDGNGHLTEMLLVQQQLVLALVEDEHLAGFFWKDPSAKNRQTARNHKHKFRSWYAEKNWTLILDFLLEKIYLLRCQLIHGAATFGGKLNRTSLRRATQMLWHLLPACLLVYIDHGADEDWGQLCYPPMQPQTTAGANGRFVPRWPR
jgi:hypothetical protein